MDDNQNEKWQTVFFCTSKRTACHFNVVTLTLLGYHPKHLSVWFSEWNPSTLNLISCNEVLFSFKTFYNIPQLFSLPESHLPHPHLPLHNTMVNSWFLHTIFLLVDTILFDTPFFHNMDDNILEYNVHYSKFLRQPLLQKLERMQ